MGGSVNLEDCGCEIRSLKRLHSEGRRRKQGTQRSVRNAWSYIHGQRSSWSSGSAVALSAAKSLVNAYLSCGNVDAVDYGVLADMEALKEKTCRKLHFNQRKFLRVYLSSYEEMVEAVLQMTNAAGSMKTYVNDSGGGLITFSNTQLDGDSGDCGGIPVFSTLPLSVHELLASEIVNMYQKELKVKWLLACEFCRLVYPDSAEAFSIQRKLSSLDCTNDTLSPTPSPGVERETDAPVEAPKTESPASKPPKRETLQVYLTSLLAEVYINRDRIEEIGRICNEEMSVGLLGTP
ncbi:hypothetical protein R1flu_015289 [Riccia fluitans]|uniref:Uncharacterized protein n=1 Tax=Riccia fluitans TaxID=41844 RepID=A0ABD1YIH5_9MARC